MFNYFIRLLAFKLNVDNWEDLESDYYNIMNKYQLEDNDIEKYSKKELITMIKSYI
jgi:hypothetical protein